ncbi:hypothetical protein [Dyadobacter sp. CY356]|uniref:hypothetical protein n=1 Tax=Dyadobacter sp. CY356 TaxID=2906442 RepID=UPI001F38FEE7|nr:hypothetical protein [Dyadobacter sp. CY356]MCF0056707.1 hypothetical protein [Dyadobacter sp. CY356]
MKSYITDTNLERSQVIKEIVSFASLNHDWDGFGALPLEVESAANAISITNRLSNSALSGISALYPNPHGTISIDWENGSNEIISLEVGNTSFSYYVKLESSEPAFFDNNKFGELEIDDFAKRVQSNLSR